MVKRYDTDRDGEEYESETGPFVHFTDYAVLTAELAECAAVRDSWCAEFVKARDALLVRSQSRCERCDSTGIEPTQASGDEKHGA